MTEIDRLYTEAAAALDAIVKYRAAERARNAKLERIDVITLRNAEPSDDVMWKFYKAASKVFEEPEVSATFAILCEDAGVDAFIGSPRNIAMFSDTGSFGFSSSGSGINLSGFLMPRTSSILRCSCGKS